jgi:pimeloyl-ACP methyl ester carboxylesterase
MPDDEPVDVTPFRVRVPQHDLDDLRQRIRQTRWPEPETVPDWSQGVPLDYLRELCRYWVQEYDWRIAEARLNTVPQYRTTIDGLGIHFLHVRSPNPAAFPLVLTHGWPGSVLEFIKVIGPLADPEQHGGNFLDAFSVVCPSLPGYGWSDKPSWPGWTVEAIAAAWAALMDRLGYARYGAVGSDWGTSISASLAQQDPDHVAGIHLIPPLAAPDPGTFDDLTAAERAALADLARAAEWEDGYSAQQSTRPQTVGYGLSDSPAGLCAWMVEKFRAWSDCNGHPENAITRDEILDDITLYWLTRSAASSARLYWESIRQVQQIFSRPGAETIDIPTGCSVFPKENPRPSRRWAAKRFTDIRYWSEPEKGGHFAALEQPKVFVRDVRSFFRFVR